MVKVKQAAFFRGEDVQHHRAVVHYQPVGLLGIAFREQRADAGFFKLVDDIIENRFGQPLVVSREHNLVVSYTGKTADVGDNDVFSLFFRSDIGNLAGEIYCFQSFSPTIRFLFSISYVSAR